MTPGRPDAHAAPREVVVALGERSYSVLIGDGLADSLGRRAAAVLTHPGRRAFLVADLALNATIVDAAAASLASAGFSVHRATLAANERRKTWDTLGQLLRGMADAGLDRGDVVIALGGGLVGDVAGLAAALYHRGLPWVNCPTTLLAMVDASVGGKTAVNLDVGAGSLRKNIIGSFHQPSRVLADVRWLADLPERDYRCGLAESIKAGLIGGLAGDSGLAGWLADALPAILGRDRPAVVELIARSVAIKASIVSGDEREDPAAPHVGRAALNLGHTFAHAMELLTGLSPTGHAADAPLRHGEAVALGLVAAARLGARAGACSTLLAERTTALVSAAGLPPSIAGLPASSDLVHAMQADKKVIGGRLRLIVPTDDHRAVVLIDPDPALVSWAWDSIRA